MHEYELHLFGHYAAAVHRGLPENGELRGELLDMCEGTLRQIGLPVKSDPEEGEDEEAKQRRKRGLVLSRINELAAKLPGTQPSPLESAIRESCSHFGLNDRMRELYGTLVRWYVQAWESPTRAVIDFQIDKFDEPASSEVAGMNVTGAELMFGLSRPEAMELLSARQSPLALTGLFVPVRSGNVIALSNWAFRAILSGKTSAEEMLAQMSESDSNGRMNLKWSGFSHLGAPRKLAGTLVDAALAVQAPGMNIMLLGEDRGLRLAFARSLARKFKSRLVVLDARRIAATAPEGREAEDVAGLVARAGWLLRGQRAIIAVDAAEDSLCDKPSGGGDQWLEGKGRWSPRAAHEKLLSVLRSIHVPALWMMADPRDLYGGVAGQMAAAVQLTAPPAAARREAWQGDPRMSAGHSAVPLANAFDGFPWEAEGALRALSVSPGGEVDIVDALRSIAAIRKGKRPAASVSQDQELAFDPALVSADHDLNALLDRLTQEDAPRAFSLLLSGPPGTGKSQWVRELASRLGLAVEMKRASSLLGKFIGESEKAIAAAFQDAEATGSFLVFDEADSLLWNRERAEQGWQVSQVNEMLTWMERHPLPFACTTNLGNAMDQASMRRFTFKVVFDFMSAPQIRAAFETFFGIEATRRAIAIPNLTPGDFAVVKKRAAILRALDDPERLTAMLELESQVKPGSKAPIGFGANAR